MGEKMPVTSWTQTCNLLIAGQLFNQQATSVLQLYISNRPYVYSTSITYDIHVRTCVYTCTLRSVSVIDHMCILQV